MEKTLFIILFIVILVVFIGVIVYYGFIKPATSVKKHSAELLSPFDAGLNAQNLEKPAVDLPVQKQSRNNNVNEYRKIIDSSGDDYKAFMEQSRRSIK